jgi:hypothetical protein
MGCFTGVASIQLVREQGQIGERTLEITSLELGAEAVPVPSVPVASYAVSPADCVSWDRQQE